MCVCICAVCRSTAILTFFHVSGGVMFIAIVVLFPVAVCIKIRRIAALDLWEDEGELIKYSNFFADFKHTVAHTFKGRTARYFFFTQHLVTTSLLAIFEVFLGFDPNLVWIVTATGNDLE